MVQKGHLLVSRKIAQTFDYHSPELSSIPNESMTREPLVIRNPGYRRHGSNHKKSRPCFFTKSVKFGFGELSICRICAESRDLQSGHGFRACSFKNKRKKLDFHTFCDQPTEKKTEKWNEIGRILVPGALNLSKKMWKTGADNFPKSSA